MMLTNPMLIILIFKPKQPSAANTCFVDADCPCHVSSAPNKEQDSGPIRNTSSVSMCSIVR